MNKARTLWRSSGGAVGGQLSLDSSTLPPDASPLSGGVGNQGRLSRWFSLRRGSTQQYDIGCNNECTYHPPCICGMDYKCGNNKMPYLPEVS